MLQVLVIADGPLLQRTTPLMIACSQAAGDTNSAIIRLLLAEHASVHATCNHQVTITSHLTAICSVGCTPRLHGGEEGLQTV